ncbi:MAG: hypothetical protein DRQ41_08020 [Gammaproteobacteria bacterium]|nr:MAG: hypothetical protein DRQ41_08020 [Gammaproteobacteria bacterium]
MKNLLERTTLEKSIDASHPCRSGKRFNWIIAACLLTVIGSSLQALDCNTGTLNELGCNASSCRYLLNFEQEGFYVITTRLSQEKTEGVWSLSIEPRQNMTIAGSFHIGAILRENGELPGFAAFFLNQSQVLTLTPYEYTNQLSQIHIRILDGKRALVYETDAVVEESIITPELQNGFYIIEVLSTNDAPRARFGLSVEMPYFPHGLNIGGWLDAVTGDNPEGFAALYLTSGPVIITLQFGESFGQIGADKPDLHISRLNETEELEPFWQTPVVAKVSQNTIDDNKDWHKPAISRDGRFVAYFAETDDERLTSPQVYLYNRQTNRNVRISTIIEYPEGAITRSNIIDLVISADGHYVAYLASEHSVGPMGGFDTRNLWLYEVETAITSLIEKRRGSVMGPRHIEHISISGDGRYFVYAPNPNLTIYDRETGTSRELDISPNDVNNFEISADGRFLVFDSSRDNIVSSDTNQGLDVFIRELATDDTRMVSILGEGNPINGQNFNPEVSADGRYVVFVSNAEPKQAIYIYDSQIGAARKITDIGNNSQPVISDDGRFVVFASTLDLSYNAIKRRSNIYVLENFGLEKSYGIKSLLAGANDDSYAPAISGDGRYITFYSYADNLVVGDTNAQADVFLFLEQQKVKILGVP